MLVLKVVNTNLDENWSKNFVNIQASETKQKNWILFWKDSRTQLIYENYVPFFGLKDTAATLTAKFSSKVL